jgi:hypothetical protein
LALDPALSSEEFLLWAYSDYIYREATVNGQAALAGDFASLDMNLGQRNGYSTLWAALNAINGGDDATRAAAGDDTAAGANGTGADEAAGATGAAAGATADAAGEDVSGAAGAAGDAGTAGEQDVTQQGQAGTSEQDPGEQEAGQGQPLASTNADGSQLPGNTARTTGEGYVSPLFDVAAPSPTTSPDFSISPYIFNTDENQLYIFDLQSNVRLIIYYDSNAHAFVGFNLQRT